jgi:hypothetical protein
MTLDDDATMREEQFLKVALATRKPTGPAATGRCLYCNAELPDTRRWCDKWCQEDWSLEIESQRRHRGRM